MKQISNRKYLLWILLATLLIRLPHLTSPMIGVQSWRQADTAAMARNFYENGFHILHPQIDWRGNTSGEVESEFPLFPFIAALLYKLFGVHDFFGRLLSICCSVLTVYVLYLFVKDWFDEKTALWSGLLYGILPLNIFFGRAFFPEPMMILSVIIGVYYFHCWITSGGWMEFFLSAISIMTACLLKIPTLYIGLPLLYMCYLKYGSKFLLQWQLWLFSIIVILPVGLWYYHAHQLFLRTGLTFGIWEYGSDKWGNWALVATWDFWNRILFQSLGERHFGWFGLFAFIYGLFFMWRSREQKILDAWFTALIVYILIVARGNYVHEYYQLPIMLPAAIIMGTVFAQYFDFENMRSSSSILLALCLAGIILLGGWRYVSYLQVENESIDELVLTSNVDNVVPEFALMIFVDRNDPTSFYLSHRKGWNAFAEDLTPAFIDDRITKGAAYLAGYKNDFGESGKASLNDLLATHRVLWQNDASFIIKL
ncbi:MAG: ArnT family glycosyltransferase [Bacteroidota bacterium]